MLLSLKKIIESRIKFYMTISELESKIISQGINPIPATSDQIQSLKNDLAIETLPSSYVEFLKRMGNGTRNGFLQGSSFFFNELSKTKSWAIELLNENNPTLTLSTNDFVFWMHQGYQFSFFKLDEGQNPPVYYYTEVNNPTSFVKITDTFTEFLSRIHSNDQNLFKI